MGATGPLADSADQHMLAAREVIAERDVVEVILAEMALVRPQRAAREVFEICG